MAIAGSNSHLSDTDACVPRAVLRSSGNIQRHQASAATVGNTSGDGQEHQPAAAAAVHVYAQAALQASGNVQQRWLVAMTL